MTKVSREFQVFAKPAGPRCNMDCSYCYYIGRTGLYPAGEKFNMSYEVLEEYIRQHIDATGEDRVMFSWHGGEPMLRGIEFFQKAVELQKIYTRLGLQIINGIQTNGTLIDDEWCTFFAGNGFYVGISLDGPEELHNTCRFTRTGRPAFSLTLNGYRLLRDHGVNCEILCVVSSMNVIYPMEVYRFFKELKAEYISFLPLVVPDRSAGTGVTEESVPPHAFGKFLCAIFDEWKENDIGKVKIQIFEEAARTAFGQDHTLCIFKQTCGVVPVVEHNGDFYCCDHFVDREHHHGNIMADNLTDLIESPAQRAFGQAKLDSLPRYCLECDVREMCNGECPKNRFAETPGGEKGLNYLCGGYRLFFRHCRPFVRELAHLWNLTR